MVKKLILGMFCAGVLSKVVFGATFIPLGTLGGVYTDSRAAAA